MLLAVCPLLAQFNSAIQGSVIDDSGGAIPRASVVVTNTSTGVVRAVSTQDDGVYRVLSLVPGTYSVHVTKAGFQPAERRDVVLGITETLKIEIVLRVGSVTEQLTVTAQSATVETEQGRVSGRVDRLQIDELPLNGRNMFNLLALQPGVTGRGLTGIGSGGDSFSGELKMEFNASGLRSEANSYTMDDTNVNSLSRGGATNLTPNADSVEEVRVVSNNFSAVDGRNGGAQIQAVSKSGTNQFHGGLSEYFQNNTLSSRSIFDTSMPVFRKNEYGYALGGPVVKNRTFFYTTFDGQESSGARVASANVETQQFRDFIVKTRPSSIAAKLLSTYKPVVYPTSNLKDLGSPGPGVNTWGPVDGIPDIGNVQFVPATYRNGKQFNGRIDHDVRPGKDRIYGNFYWNGSDVLNGGVRPDFDRPTVEHTFFYSVNYTHIFSATTLNEFRTGMMRDVGKTAATPHLDVPGIGISGETGYGNSYYPAAWFQTNFHYKDMLSLVRSNHSLKIGAELRRARQNTWNTNYFVPQYTFASVLDFADGEALQEQRKVDPRTGEPATTVVGERFWEWAAFVQDDWKVRPNLTLNIGVRYENFRSPTEVNGLLRNFIFGAGSGYFDKLGAGKADVVPQLYPADNNNFAPRFGFAWDPSRKGTTAIRGGYGIAYDRPGTYFLYFKDLPPLRAEAVLGPQFGTQFTYGLGDVTKPYLGYPVDPALKVGLDDRNGIKGVRVALSTVDPNLSTAYVQNWFVGIQHVLPLGIVADLNYLGSAGHKLYDVTNVNRFVGDMMDGRFNGFNPSFSKINMQESVGNSVYHGGSLSLRRPFRNGFTLQGAYTFGKAIDDTDSLTSDTNYQDAANRRLDRGIAAYDVSQKLSIVGVWELPFLRAKSGLIPRVAGGWQLSGFGIFQTGTPFNVTNSAVYPRGDFNGDNNGGDRPNAPAAGVLRSGLSRTNFVNGVFAIADFPTPTLGTNGNLGRDMMRGPGFAQVDMELSKKFPITERISAQLRIDALNAFNRVNLNNPVSDLNNISFGRSTSTLTPRLLQVGVRVRF
jgi:hypothetical protein